MISFKSPIAQALLGKNIGETVKSESPGWHIRIYNKKYYI